MSSEYNRILKLLKCIPLLAIGCYLLKWPMLYSLVPILVLAVLDIWTALLFNADFTEYEEDTPSYAANGRAKLRKLLPPKTSKRYLVVGCGGVGNRIVTMLQERGEKHVFGMDISEKNSISLDKQHFVWGNVTDMESCRAVIEKVKPDIVYHTAAIITINHRLESEWPISYNVNVKGVLNMIEASASAEAFILTSSASVGLTRQHAGTLFEGNEISADPHKSMEDAPNWYIRSKSMAEVESVNLIKSLPKAPAFGIIRPASLIVHERDSLSFQKALLENSAVAIGFERGLLDVIFVDNVVLGHLMLEQQLLQGKCNGETFIVSNQEPMTSLEYMRRLRYFIKKTKTHEKDFTYNKMPSLVIWIIANISSMLQRFEVELPTDVKFLTPTMLSYTNYDYIFKDEKAKEMLGYEPAFTVNEGILQMLENFRQQRLEPRAKDD